MLVRLPTNRGLSKLGNVWLKFADESSTLASIVCSNLHHIADSPHQSSIRTLLQEVAAKALDATPFPIVSNEDSSAPALHQPSYERHVVQEYVDGMCYL